MMNRDLAVVRDALHDIFQQAQGSCESTEELEELRERLASGNAGLQALAKTLGENSETARAYHQRTSADAWIPVGERLPEQAGMYLCYHCDHGQDVIFFDGKRWGKTSFWDHEDPHHWQNLPGDPKVTP